MNRAERSTKELKDGIICDLMLIQYERLSKRMVIEMVKMVINFVSGKPKARNDINPFKAYRRFHKEQTTTEINPNK